MNQEEIIKNYGIVEWANFLMHDKKGKIIELLDDVGLSMLNSLDKITLSDRIRYILEYSKYRDTLLKNNKFIKLLYSTNINNYYNVLTHINLSSCKNILEYARKMNPQLIIKVFLYFNVDNQLKLLEEWNYPSRYLCDILLASNNNLVIEKILQSGKINLEEDPQNIEKIIDKIKEINSISMKKRNLKEIDTKDIMLPTNLITNNFAKAIWDNYKIVERREILNNLMYIGDYSVANNYIKTKEDTEIINSNQTELIMPYLKMYSILLKYKSERNKYIKKITKDSSLMYELEKEYNRLLFKEVINKESFEKMHINNSVDDIYNYFVELSNKKLSEYIIDYHFEENYYNVILDINELLGFYYRSNIELPHDRVEIYETIKNIDNLSRREKIELHNKLKEIDIMGLFYDDMSYSRNIVAASLKDYALSKESLKKYQNSNLSKKYGVPVYDISNKKFFAVVKSGTRISALPRGHSYSLIGAGALTVFGDPSDMDTFLYDSNTIDPNQLVHVFPFDSFTAFMPFENYNKATSKINRLRTPEELIKETKTYNEILFLEQGLTETEMDKKIPKLKKIALYCLDRIREEDVETAKHYDVGIVFIDTKKYHQFENTSSIKNNLNTPNMPYDYIKKSSEIENYRRK